LFQKTAKQGLGADIAPASIKSRLYLITSVRTAMMATAVNGFYFEAAVLFALGAANRGTYVIDDLDGATITISTVPGTRII
jgi:hypothetical protein